jgi:hydroxymethylpyrimidine pyrophosphatase-like HAD family hydrolase
MIIAFDVDNTLLVEKNGVVVVNHDMVILMRAIYTLGLADIVVWSGGGDDYAKQIVRKYGLSDMVSVACMKGTLLVDIAIDDQDIDLAKVNLKLPGDIEATPWMGLW